MNTLIAQVKSYKVIKFKSFSDYFLLYELSTFKLRLRGAFHG